MRHIIVKGMGIISIVLLCCTLICGIWVGTQPVEDMSFHAMLSGVTVVFAIITQTVYIVKCRFCNGHKK